MTDDRTNAGGQVMERDEGATGFAGEGGSAGGSSGIQKPGLSGGQTGAMPPGGWPAGSSHGGQLQQQDEGQDQPGAVDKTARDLTGQDQPGS